LLDDANVTGFRLWRATEMNRAVAQEVPLPAGVSAAVTPGETMVVHDAAADPAEIHYYWLEAVVTGGAVIDLGVTSTQQGFRSVYLPVLKQ
jgi:hypothetical protein